MEKELKIIESIVNQVLTSRNCVYNFATDEVIHNITTVMKDLTNDDYSIEKIKYHKNGFGFSTENDFFCHTKNGQSCVLDQMSADTMYLIHAEHTPKGWGAKWFAPVDAPAIKDALKYILQQTVEYMIKQEDERLERVRIFQEAQAAKKAAQEAAMKEIGIEGYQIISERHNYRGYRMCYEYIYRFENEIDKDTFMKFLAIIGERTEAKDLGSFMPEEVNIRSCGYYSTDSSTEWKYEWKQGYND